MSSPFDFDDRRPRRSRSSGNAVAIFGLVAVVLLAGALWWALRPAGAEPKKEAEVASQKLPPKGSKLSEKKMKVEPIKEPDEPEPEPMPEVLPLPPKSKQAKKDDEEDITSPTVAELEKALEGELVADIDRRDMRQIVELQHYLFRPDAFGLFSRYPAAMPIFRRGAILAVRSDFQGAQVIARLEIKDPNVQYRLALMGDEGRAFAYSGAGKLIDPEQRRREDFTPKEVEALRALGITKKP